MHCPHCDSQSIVKNGKYSLQDGTSVQHYLCKACSKRFSDKTGTPIAGLRTPASIVSIALKMPGEGMGVRASSRVLDKSHSTLVRWETRMAAQAAQWLPSAPPGSDVTLENDQLYTRYAVNLSPPSPKGTPSPPCKSEGWTLTCIERASRYWVTAQMGRKQNRLFEQGVKHI